MSKVNCSKEDILCHVLVNMTMQMNTVSYTAVTEPATCNMDLASFCIASYVGRIVVSPFTPVQDHERTCRSVNRYNVSRVVYLRKDFPVL